ncbi:MAG: transposase [Parabacteroides sp.]
MFYLFTVTTYNALKQQRQFACYAGVAPFEYSSGTSVKGGTHTQSLSQYEGKIASWNGGNECQTVQ